MTFLLTIQRPLPIAIKRRAARVSSRSCKKRSISQTCGGHHAHRSYSSAIDPEAPTPRMHTDTRSSLLRLRSYQALLSRRNFHPSSARHLSLRRSRNGIRWRGIGTGKKVASSTLLGVRIRRRGSCSAESSPRSIM